jgi:hypothetical protein
MADLLPKDCHVGSHVVALDLSATPAPVSFFLSLETQTDVVPGAFNIFLLPH